METKKRVRATTSGHLNAGPILLHWCERRKQPLKTNKNMGNRSVSAKRSYDSVNRLFNSSAAFWVVAAASIAYLGVCQLAEGFDGFIEYKLPISVEIAPDFRAFSANLVKPRCENIGIFVADYSSGFRPHSAHQSDKVLFSIFPSGLRRLARARE